MAWGQSRPAVVALVIMGVGLLAHSGPGYAAEDPLEGDLRDLKVGEPVGALPMTGYVNLACGTDGGEPGTELAAWSDYGKCPTDEAGLHEVTFEYAESPLVNVGDRWEGTKVAGHPVIPSLLIDAGGTVHGIRIVTDPTARTYLKKKAFLLGVRVMGRYGKDGWDCVEAAPGDGKEPIGGMFIDRRCEKQYHDRHLILQTDLYRGADQKGTDFTGGTRLEILKDG